MHTTRKLLSSARRALIVILPPYEIAKSYGRGDGHLIVRACPELLVQAGHQENQEAYKKFQNVHSDAWFPAALHQWISWKQTLWEYIGFISLGAS